MNEAQIHLLKTLTAMRWIMLMNGNIAVAKAIEIDMENYRQDKPPPSGGGGCQRKNASKKGQP